MTAPLLRFPEFSEGWKSTLLCDLGKIYQPKTISQSEMSKDGQYPVYGANGIVGRHNSYNHELRQVAVSCRGSCGNIHYTEPKSWICGNAMVINMDECEIAEKLFTYYSLSSSDLTYLVTGSAQPQITGEIKNHNILLPSLAEQRRIADALSAVDAKIDLLTRKRDNLARFKAGLMQKIFSREVRFTREDGSAYPDWEEKKLEGFLREHRLHSVGGEPVYSVSVHKGLIDQVEHLGRSFSAADTSHYNLVQPGDVVYTKSPTGDFPLGIIKQSFVDINVIVSPLYGVFSPSNTYLGHLIHSYFESAVATVNYLTPLVQKGAKNTISVTNKTFLSGKIVMPTDEKEQRKISEAILNVSNGIDILERHIATMQAFKKGLLQQMFV